jgi:hypothetical protein
MSTSRSLIARQDGEVITLTPIVICLVWLALCAGITNTFSIPGLQWIFR